MQMTLRSAALVAVSVCAACGSGEESGDEAPGSGDIVAWAGDGTQGHDGDGNHRSESWFNQPMEVAFSADGGALVVDWNNHSLRRIDAAGIVQTVIGDELPGDWPCQEPDDPLACTIPLDQPAQTSEVKLNHPMDVAPAPDGGWFLAAWHNHKLERIDPGDATVRVLAGQQRPGFEGDDGPASAARLNFPDSLVVASDGALLVSDERNNRVRRVAEGMITTVVGSNTASALSGESGPAAQSELALSPYNEEGGADNPPPGGGLALDDAGNLYVADSYNHCIRRVAPGADGVVGAGPPEDELMETVAGQCGTEGYSGDGGDATAALLSKPHDLEIGPDGALYVADAGNHAVRRVDVSSREIRTIVGTGVRGDSGDGGPATAARLNKPYGIAFDSDGALYVVDTANSRIRKVLP